MRQARQRALFQKTHHGFVEEIPGHKLHPSSGVCTITKAFETI
jgi:hypothetical protein